MDLERLGFTPEQRASIDDEFLATTLDMLNQAQTYDSRAYRTAGPLGDELEQIFIRTFDAAHKDIIANKPEIDIVTRRSLARLSFIDSLVLPSGKLAKEDAPDKVRARRAFAVYQRLFIDMPNAD